MANMGRGPLSPPSSNPAEMLQNGFQHLVQHNSGLHYTYSDVDYNEAEQFHSGKQSLYGSPDPMYPSIGYHYSGNQQAYSYPSPWQGHGTGMNYEGLSPVSNQPAEHSDHKLSQYNTPSGSPPASTMSTPASDAIRTRSGLVINRSRDHKSLPTNMDSLPSSSKLKKGRKDRGKAEKKVAKLEKPLSELTKDWTHVPVVDIEAYVNRSAELRRKEVEESKMPGRVKRPMNSFMLYRKAYQNRCKHWCLQNNHQVVSQVCGDSWPLEPDSVREQFNEWARIERIHHQNAHPGYKFSPAKAGSNKATKRKPQEEITSEESELDDYDWEKEPVKRTKTSNKLSRVEPDSRSRTKSPYEFCGNFSEEPSCDGYNVSSYYAAKQIPPQYGHPNLDGGYYQQAAQQHVAMPAVEDIFIKKQVPPTGMNFLGLPGGTDLTNPFHTQGDYKIDPSLVDQTTMMYDTFQTQDMYGLPWQESFDNGYLQIPDGQGLRTPAEDWRTEPLDESQEFNKWMDEEGAVP